MLSVYTRHYPPCTHTDINHRRCRCPKWIQGTLDDGRLIRQSADTRNWEKAELKARRLEDEADPQRPAARTRVTIADAIQSFRDDEKSRHLSKDSNAKSAFFFEKQLKTWAEKQGFVHLDQWTAAALTVRTLKKKAATTLSALREQSASEKGFGLIAASSTTTLREGIRVDPRNPRKGFAFREKGEKKGQPRRSIWTSQ